MDEKVNKKNKEEANENSFFIYVCQICTQCIYRWPFQYFESKFISKNMPNASYVLLFDGQLYIWKTCHKNVSKVILNVSHC